MANHLTPHAEVVRRCRVLHGDAYNYDNMHYKGQAFEITVTCPLHGDFLVHTQSHYTGKGCTQCFVESESRYAEIDAFYIPYDTKYPLKTRTHGVPCKRGHMLEQTKRGQCRLCRRMTSRRNYWPTRTKHLTFGNKPTAVKGSRRRKRMTIEHKQDRAKRKIHKKTQDLLTSWTISHQ